jgi:hypothetical protein
MASELNRMSMGLRSRRLLPDLRSCSRPDFRLMIASAGRT